jgi:inhibitor of KinA sporulation pathway (predicted exonuclease)
LKKRNELPNITNADMINAFICNMTYEALIHMLSRKTPRTTQELLDITT